MIIKDAKFVTSDVDGTNYPKDQLPQIVFSGRSNVGKSSFINSILNMKSIARVSQTPGKTRLINFFLINDAFYFVDIPGYGYAKVSHAELVKFAAMIDAYLKSKQSSFAVILLDIRRKPNEDDLLMYEFFKSFDYDVMIILTKADKLSNNKIAKQKRLIRSVLNPHEGDEMIEYSIKTKINREHILERLESYVNG